MAEVLLAAKGTNGQLQIEGDMVRILRKGAMGFLTQGIKCDKEIYVGDISSIQMKNADRMTRGYFNYTFTGGREAKGGIFQATRDEYTVMFVGYSEHCHP